MTTLYTEDKIRRVMGSVLAQKPFQGVKKAPSQLYISGDYVVFPA